MKIDNDITAWFSREDPVFQDYERFRQEFAGTRTLIVALQADTPSGSSRATPCSSSRTSLPTSNGSRPCSASTAWRLPRSSKRCRARMAVSTSGR